MTFTITHRDGSMDEGHAEALPSLLTELDGPLDNEHPDVSVADDDSGWMLSAFQSGRVVWENVEDDDEQLRHMTAVSRDDVLRLMHLVVDERLDEVHDEAWLPGYTSS